MDRRCRDSPHHQRKIFFVLPGSARLRPRASEAYGGGEADEVSGLGLEGKLAAYAGPSSDQDRDVGGQRVRCVVKLAAEAWW